MKDVIVYGFVLVSTKKKKKKNLLSLKSEIITQDKAKAL